MTITKTDSGKWQVDVQPGGRGGRRLRKSFERKADAIAWRLHILSQAQQEPEWKPPKKDARPLSDLANQWFDLHGRGLNDGERTLKRLIRMAESMGNPRADQFKASTFAEYRASRISTGITENNMNREQSYLSAMFNELIRIGEWRGSNPLSKLRKFKIQEAELSFLALEQIPLLLKECGNGRNPHTALIAQVCLSTGSRWGEAEGLRLSQIKNNQIQFVQTKSAKARSVPISNKLQGRLHTHHAEHAKAGESRLFSYAWSAFREAVERAQIDLPKGQQTHVLRHTFASHFMMNGGNIITLQRILGHHSLAMTMRYAHLAPDHLREATQLNPLKLLNLG